MVRTPTIIAAMLFCATAALAADIPMDDAGFTAYVQKRLQLYAPATITVTGPFALAAGPRALPSLKPVHDACVAKPAECGTATNDYVQDAARDLQTPAPASAPPPAEAGVTTLYTCNATQRTLNIATIYVPVGSTAWRSAGWTGLDAGKCMGVLQTAGDTFYARAEETNRAQVHDPHARNGMSDSDSGIPHAAGDIDLCVAHVGNWDVSAADLKGVCKGVAGESAQFRTFHADGKPAVVWKLAF
jgi:uncharacterized membrane protein